MKTALLVCPLPLAPFARFPFFNMMSTQNGFGALIVMSHPKVTISSEFHSLPLGKNAQFGYLEFLYRF
jgi:hypothetical protein